MSHFYLSLYDQRSFPSAYNTSLYRNSSIFAEFGCIILKKILIFGLSCDVELASTIVKVGLICPNYTILLRVLLVLVYLGLGLAIFYMLWCKKRLLLHTLIPSSCVASLRGLGRCLWSKDAWVISCCRIGVVSKG